MGDTRARVAAGDADRDALAVAAEELPQRQAGGLRLEVPDGDVGTAQGAHEQPALADGQVGVVGTLPDGFAAEGIGPEQERGDVPCQDRRDRRIAGHPEADAGQPVVGHELDDEVLATIEPQLAHHDRRRQRDPARRQPDLDDLHLGLLGWMTSTCSSGASSFGPTPARKRTPDGPALMPWTTRSAA